ncbi:MAG TPA: S-layer homology domain-containing protein [Chloroflexia bacterium]|nr:S-layer homology domain-containing protein [Chloroflexia bacterium]
MRRLVAARLVGLLVLALGLLAGAWPAYADEGKTGGPAIDPTPTAARRTPAPEPNPPAVPASPLGPLPAGLPSTFWLGVSSSPTDLAWMTGSGVPWSARYQYLSGGVNTGNGWAGWNTPAGQFASYYMEASADAHIIPVFTYYQLLQSAPGTGGSEAEIDYNNVNDPATMAAYYADFRLLLQKAAAFGQPVVVQVEPDFWGYMQGRVADTTNSAASVPAAVAASGFPAVAGYPNTVQGFAQALLHLRDSTAPNVILAIHASAWAWGGDDIGISHDPTLDPNAVGQTVGAFLLTAGISGNPAGTSAWDLVMSDPSDRDAAWYQLVRGDGGAHWWDLGNNSFPNFDRYRLYLAALNATTGRRLVLWQIPTGNTLMRSEDNTAGHYQDNRAQGFLGNNGAALPGLVDAGVIGLLWGAGEGAQTHPTDAHGDGVTNPAAINGNTGVATVTDDDGGYLRAQAAAYYTRGPLPLPGGACGVFTDVPVDYWAGGYIQWLACRNVVGGYADGTFHPDATTTRAQFAKMLALGMGWPLVNPSTPSFSDVPSGYWGYSYIETVRAHNAISGYSDGTYRPSNNVTRAQLSKMIVSAEGWTLVTPSVPSFTDVPVSHWAYSYVETSRAHGVVSGYSDGTFRPLSSGTRAQLSKMLYTALGGP